jgi:hypothetical protein
MRSFVGLRSPACSLTPSSARLRRFPSPFRTRGASRPQFPTSTSTSLRRPVPLLGVTAATGPPRRLARCAVRPYVGCGGKRRTLMLHTSASPASRALRNRVLSSFRAGTICISTYFAAHRFAGRPRAEPPRTLAAPARPSRPVPLYPCRWDVCKTHARTHKMETAGRFRHGTVLF